MQGERFIPAFLIMKKDLSAKQNFNGEGQKTRLFNQILLPGPVFRQLALIKMESFPVGPVETVPNWSYLSTRKN